MINVSDDGHVANVGSLVHDGANLWGTKGTMVSCASDNGSSFTWSIVNRTCSAEERERETVKNTHTAAAIGLAMYHMVRLAI